MALITDLVSYYKCDENAGNTSVVDSHGSNDGVATENTSVFYDASGKINSCFDLEKSNTDYITIADDNTLDFGTGDFTIGCWIYPESFTSADPIFSKRDNAGSLVGFTVQLTNSGYNDSVLLIVRDAAGVTVTVKSTITNADLTGSFNYLSIVRDGLNSFKIYLNGVDETSTKVGTFTNGNISNTKDFKIGGNRNTPPNGWFDGKIDEFGIWSRALTTAEILELTNSGSGLAYPFTTGSPSSSVSPSSSLSPSSSVSLSISPSSSVSLSISPSSSASLSQSPSSSVSLSISPSASVSPSSSSSLSLSPSSSVSLSPSSSPSSSVSLSISASPSPGTKDYTRGDEVSLPGDNTDLETGYSAGDITTVSTIDGSRVDQTGTGEFIIHQFKTFVGVETIATITSVGQSTQAPSDSTVYLQMYNRNTTTWDTIDDDNATAANTNFTLTDNVASLTNYKDASNVISCRVYQESTL